MFNFSEGLEQLQSYSHHIANVATSKASVSLAGECRQELHFTNGPSKTIRMRAGDVSALTAIEDSGRDSPENVDVEVVSKTLVLFCDTESDDGDKSAVQKAARKKVELKRYNYKWWADKYDVQAKWWPDQCTTTENTKPMQQQPHSMQTQLKPLGPLPV